MPKKKNTGQPKPLYRTKPPKPERGLSQAAAPANAEAHSKRKPPPYPLRVETTRAPEAFPHAHAIIPSHFELREDGTIAPFVVPPSGGAGFGVPPSGGADTLKRGHQTAPPSTLAPRPSTAPALIFHSDAPFLRLYHGNALELLDAIAAKYPEGRFDAIFADPPYFLSNGGITCHAGRMVKVDKGDWDKSRGPELNHEFNLAWLTRCQRVLKPNGTIWVSGTHHVIFSIGYALQQLGYKILNDIAWEKPNPPPNLGCRCFTHSTETVLWAAKNDKSKHVFNYQEMRKVTGKQMKTVWRKEEFWGSADAPSAPVDASSTGYSSREARNETREARVLPGNVWTLTAPGSDEKQFGKHPTQKPVALVERCLLAATNQGDLVLDPFLGGGTTAFAT